MRLLVVTLATIENDLEACLAAIARQTHPDFEHLVFRNLPDREAHEALYGTFMDRRLARVVLGGELALAGQFGEDQLDYDNADVEPAFSAFAACDAGALEVEIRRARRVTWGLLPSGLRMDLLRGDWLSLLLRWAIPVELRDRARGVVQAVQRRLGRWWRP